MVRREAEHIARKKRPKGDDDITFDDIYRELELLIGPEKIEQLKQCEMQVESDIEDNLFLLGRVANSIFDPFKKAGN